jgi:hypothetical protein
MLLSPGPTWSIYYRRGVTASGVGFGATTNDIGGPNSEDRLQYISALGNFQQGMRLSAAEYKSVPWRGQKALESEKKKFRQDILVRHGLLVRRLVGAHLLTAEEARAVPKPTIETRIQDFPSNGKL